MARLLEESRAVAAFEPRQEQVLEAAAGLDRPLTEDEATEWTRPWETMADSATYSMGFAGAFATDALADLSRMLIRYVSKTGRSQSVSTAEATVRMDDVYYLHRALRSAHVVLLRAFRGLGPSGRRFMRRALWASVLLAGFSLATVHLALVHPATRLAAGGELSQLVLEAGGWGAGSAVLARSAPSSALNIVHLEILNAAWPESWLRSSVGAWLQELRLRVGQGAEGDRSPAIGENAASALPDIQRTELLDVRWLAALVLHGYDFCFPVPRYEITYGCAAPALLELRSKAALEALGLRPTMLRVSATDRRLFGRSFSPALLSLFRLYDVFVLHALPTRFSSSSATCSSGSPFSAAHGRGRAIRRGDCSASLLLPGEGPEAADAGDAGDGGAKDAGDVHQRISCPRFRLHVFTYGPWAQVLEIPLPEEGSAFLSWLSWLMLWRLLCAAVILVLVLGLLIITSLLLSAFLRRMVVLTLRMRVYFSLTWRQVLRHAFIAESLRCINRYSSTELLELWTAWSVMVAISLWVLWEAARKGVFWVGWLVLYAVAEYWGIVHVRTKRSRWLFPRGLAGLHVISLAYAVAYPLGPSWLLLWILASSQLCMMFELFWRYDSCAVLPARAPHRLLFRSLLLPAEQIARAAVDAEAEDADRFGSGSEVLRAGCRDVLASFAADDDLGDFAAAARPIMVNHATQTAPLD